MHVNASYIASVMQLTFIFLNRLISYTVSVLLWSRGPEAIAGFEAFCGAFVVNIDSRMLAGLFEQAGNVEMAKVNLVFFCFGCYLIVLFLFI